jgi:hypothetical protein
VVNLGAILAPAEPCDALKVFTSYILFSDTIGDLSLLELVIDQSHELKVRGGDFFYNIPFNSSIITFKYLILSLSPKAAYVFLSFSFKSFHIRPIILICSLCCRKREINSIINHPNF